MLCRVVDSLFWMSRYIERAENTARLMDVNLQMVLESDHSGGENFQRQWEAILRSTGDLALFHKHYETADSVTVMEFLTFNRKNPSSVVSCIASARENARQIRDQITSEMWEVINRLHLFLKTMTVDKMMAQGASDFFKEIREYIHLFQGITASTYPRQLGYDFIRAGQYLERADKTGRILDIKYWILLPSLQDVGGALDVAQWAALLRACSALDAYHWNFVSEVNPKNVASLLILSSDFPRSIRFCLEKFDEALHHISHCPAREYSNDLERISGRLLSDLNYTTPEEIMRIGIHEYLEQLQVRIDELGVKLSETYMFFPVYDPALEAAKQVTSQKQ